MFCAGQNATSMYINSGEDKIIILTNYICSKFSDKMLLIKGRAKKSNTLQSQIHKVTKTNDTKTHREVCM